MRQNEAVQNQNQNPLFDVSFHSFLERDAQSAHALEMASEFGLSLGEVRKLRRALNKR
ncbi:MAG: RNA polymerase subunit sigma-70 [Bacilli bacterium]